MNKNVISTISIAGAVFGLISILTTGHLTFIPVMITLLSISVSVILP